MPVCRSKNQQLFSGILVRKSNCQLCRPANKKINTFSLTYTIAKTSSAGLPINKSTAFFWHTCSKIELPPLPVYQSTNQHNFSDIYSCKCQLCRSVKQQINIFFLAYMLEKFSELCGQPMNQSLPFLCSTERCFLCWLQGKKSNSMLLSIFTLPVCQSTYQHIFSDIHVQKFSLQCFMSTTYGGLPISFSTSFFWHIYVFFSRTTLCIV